VSGVKHLLIALKTILSGFPFDGIGFPRVKLGYKGKEEQAGHPFEDQEV